MNSITEKITGIEEPSDITEREDLSPINTKSLLEPVLRRLVILLLILHMGIFLLFSYRLLVYPYDWDPSESDHIYYTTRLLHGETLYKNNNSFPFLSLNYPPLYYILLAPSVKLFGPTMFSGRVVSLILAALVGFLMYKIMRNQSDSKLLATVTALSLFAYGPVSIWLALVRMDTAYIIFALLGIYLTSMHKRGHTYIILASICFACSFFTKQLGLFALGAGMLYLLFSKEFRKTVELLLVFLILTIPLNLLLNSLTDGWYYQQLFGLNVHRDFMWWRRSFLLSFIFAVPVFLAGASYEILQEMRDKKFSIWACYLLGSFSVASLIFFDGTGENYFLPLFSAVLIMAGLGFSKIFSRIPKEHPHWRIFLYLLIAFQLITFASSKHYLKGPTGEDRIELDTLAKLIQNSGQPVLVDRMSSLILGTKHLDYFVEPVPLMQLYLSRKWNPDELVAAVAERKFSMIVLFDKTQFVPPLLQAIDRFYTPFASFPIKRSEPNNTYKLIIYKPK